MQKHLSSSTLFSMTMRITLMNTKITKSLLICIELNTYDIQINRKLKSTEIIVAPNLFLRQRGSSNWSLGKSTLFRFLLFILCLSRTTEYHTEILAVQNEGWRSGRSKTMIMIYKVCMSSTSEKKDAHGDPGFSYKKLLSALYAINDGEHNGQQKFSFLKFTKTKQFSLTFLLVLSILSSWVSNSTGDVELSHKHIMWQLLKAPPHLCAKAEETKI